ncbi:MAG: class I SAM-dependent methyltransferase [Bacteroidetes bacterium]|nr:class I SAM-dependent methyltransferase [Fibrella sp.]
MAIDLFSGHADQYAQYRIDYPAELYDFILARVPLRQTAWDCATGNGQVALALADMFERIEATDISENQLAQAVQHANVHYQVGPAERTTFPDHHFDLITVAQALHWFDADAFHAEVRRVGKPGAVIAEWGYGLNQVDEAIDALVLDFYRNRVGPYWDSRRRLIDEQYASLPFPFADEQRADFLVRRAWTLDRFLNYLRTWSSVQKYKFENGDDPVTALGEALLPVWGEGEKEVRFPVFLRAGIV